MLFGYELDKLLQHKENRDKVADILTFLETDLVSEELFQYRAELINRLREMGEDKLYERAKEREEDVKKVVGRFT
ncbi:hypothetical protein [Mahella australiensis]|uniref:Uncharacterized protein n=1 Tax=Mahella australiensis (strain DSM 15567 / CIP 107919 / 50-1 BON) TaxID=697281 RepID=F3ZVE7_MAHA5|nr:hypothetical protein [Mahella australiensis]AEE95297.1 hypothetical protein Mahau_0074 [Mahella australiensis 50-1 BON]